MSRAEPIPRGTPCVLNQATRGEATAATIPAASTGSTITYVSESSQMMPTSSSVMPTSSQDAWPKPRSHCGTANTPLNSLGSILL